MCWNQTPVHLNGWNFDESVYIKRGSYEGGKFAAIS